jgi:hypothetical protein
MSAYSSTALEAIADKIGRCREGRDHAEMLEHIERAAQDYLAGKGAPPAEVRNQLHNLSAAVEEADRLLAGLDVRADLRLAWAGMKRGFVFHHDYLENLAEMVAAAADAEDELVSSGPEEGALNSFIRALSSIIEYFAGWHAVSTHTRVFIDAPDDAEHPELLERTESRYSGKFLDVVKACAEPLGVKKKDPAWDKAIRRALARDKLAA